MYPISSNTKALYDAEQRKVLRITGTDKNGTAINITEANVRLSGFSIDRFCCVGQKLEIGTACASEMDLTLYNPNGAFDNIVFEGTELLVEVGIADWSATTPSIQYMPCGYFTPDEQPRKMYEISIKALDRMTKFDAVHPTLTPWTDNNGNVMTDNNGNIIYFAAELAFPCTVAQMVAQCCLRCQVPFTQDLSGFPNYNLQMTALPAIQQDITFRNIIQWCAGIMGTCAFIDWNGNLVFKWYSSASYTTTAANRYASDLQENDIKVTGVEYTNTSNVTILSGSDDYALDLTGNYLASSKIATILPAVKNAVNGFTYRPFTAEVVNAPYLWPLDIITFTDKEGTNHSCAVTNVNFTLNGTTMLEGKGMTSKVNSDDTGSGVTKDQGLLIEQAAEETRQLDQSLNQEEIFNRLTDNGEEQGMILYNGKIYLNASYIQTGTMVADFIKGGTLQVAGDSYWDSTGLHVKSGAIELRQSSAFGLNISEYGDLAIGTLPSNMSSFDGNRCGFQVNNHGDFKSVNIKIYGEPSSGANYVQYGSIVGTPANTNDGTPAGMILLAWDGSGVSSAVLHVLTDGIRVSGKANVSGGLSVSIDANISRHLSVGGDAVITGDLDVSGDLDVTGAVSCSNIPYYGGPPFGECDTAAATQEKAVTITGITDLRYGMSIRVLFKNAQGYNGNPTLNLNSLGAKYIYRTVPNNTQAAVQYEWGAGEVLDLVYDGSEWVIVNGGNLKIG